MPDHARLPWDPHTQRPDVAVLVALKEELRELLVVAGEPHAWPDPKHGSEDYLLLASCDGQRPYRVVVFLMGDMGPPAAVQAANRLLELQPALAVSLGIACSLDDEDLRLCDVIVANQVDGYDEKGKAVDDGEGWALRGGGEVYRVTDDVTRMADQLEMGAAAAFRAWGAACAEDLGVLVGDDEVDRQHVARLVRDRKLRKTPSVVKAHLASGMTVAAAKAFRTWVLARDRNIKALEMEAVGLLRAAQERKVPVDTLVLRGISDLGDGDKKALDAIGDRALRRAAMRNATRLLWALMRTGRLPRVKGEDASVVQTPAGQAPSPTVQDDGPLDLGRVVDLLAGVLSDGPQAVLVAEMAGFPRAQLPAFTNGLVFWHKVVQQAEDGVLAGGARPLLVQAAKLFPNNSELARWRS